LLVIALAAVLVVEFDGLTDTPRVKVAVSAPGVDDSPAVTIAAVPAEASREIVDRPLFFASRRPLPPEPPPVVEARPEPEPPLNFVLVGTILTDSSRTALVKPEKMPPLELAPGQSLGGWIVSAIDVDRIMVRHGATEQLLGLRDFGAPKAQPAVTRAPVAARPPPPAPAAQPAAPPNPSGAARRQTIRR
jgi:hypothetical protein